VPTGGGDVPSGGGGYEYIDISGMQTDKYSILLYSAVAKFNINGSILIHSFNSLYASMGNQVVDYAIAIAIDLSVEIYKPGSGKADYRTVLESEGLDLASLPRITKEQFYNFEA
jgi:hypothetical protein